METSEESTLENSAENSIEVQSFSGIDAICWKSGEVFGDNLLKDFPVVEDGYKSKSVGEKISTAYGNRLSYNKSVYQVLRKHVFALKTADELSGGRISNSFDFTKKIEIF